jgi:hypothetical protein
MRSRALAIPRADPMAVLAWASLVSASALFAGVMIWRQMTLASLTAYGPICGDHGLSGASALGHCPACYVAAALAAAGLLAGARVLART